MILSNSKLKLCKSVSPSAELKSLFFIHSFKWTISVNVGNSDEGIGGDVKHSQRLCYWMLNSQFWLDWIFKLFAMSFSGG